MPIGVPAVVTSAAEWLRLGLLVVAGAAAVTGTVELYRLAVGRRTALPGYGWEAEVAHVAMNLAMAGMLTPLWSSRMAWSSGILLCGVAVMLAIIPAMRPHHPAIERNVIVIATTIHVFASALMAWLMVRMAPMATAAGQGTTIMHHGAMMHDMAMPSHQHSVGPSWLTWLCAAFFLFDLLSVIAVTALARGRVDCAGDSAPPVSIVPHLAMDIGMVAMLVAI